MKRETLLKTLLKFIRKIDYTVDFEENGISLTEYDEGWRAACELLAEAVKIYDYSRVRCFFYGLYFRLRYRDGKEKTQKQKKVGQGRRSRVGEKTCLDAPDACCSKGQGSEAKC